MRYGFDEISKRTKKAIINYGMINDEKNIMVGLSGGKDSSVLLYTLKKFQAISKYKFHLAAGHISLGFPGEDVSLLDQYCRELDVPFYHEKTQIGPLVFDVRKEENPCSLCAKMRRGALNNLAKENGFDKVALAHHQDDVVETLLLKTFFEGRIACFNPVTYLDRRDLTVIRPLIYVPEAQIAYFARKTNIPIITNPCPASGKTKRQEMKDLLALMDQMSPLGKDRAVGALEKLFGKYWDGQKGKLLDNTNANPSTNPDLDGKD